MGLLLHYTRYMTIVILIDGIVTHLYRGLPMTMRRAPSPLAIMRIWSRVGRWSVTLSLSPPVFGIVPRGLSVKPADVATPIFLCPQSRPKDLLPRIFLIPFPRPSPPPLGPTCCSSHESPQTNDLHRSHRPAQRKISGQMGKTLPSL